MASEQLAELPPYNPVFEGSNPAVDWTMRKRKFMKFMSINWANFYRHKLDKTSA